MGLSKVILKILEYIFSFILFVFMGTLLILLFPFIRKYDDKEE